MAQIVVLKRAHFFSLDNDIIDVHAKTIGAIGVAIYTTLARYANRKTGQCWPSIEHLAQTLDLARSTVKVYLRKLEDVGLIAIQERQDAAGDPTSNLYTLLDPSPGAVHHRRASRAAMAAPTPEGGRPPADPPPVVTQPTGRPPADPEPDLDPLTKAQNQEGHAHAADKTPKAPAGNPCPHPLEEHSHFGDVVICQHCWSMIDVRTLSRVITGADAHEEGSPTASHAASCVA
jgi:hypothetical protein